MGAARVTRPFMDGHGQVQWDPSDKVEVGNRLVPREIFAHIRGGTTEPDLFFKIEVREGIPQWSEVAFRSRPDGPEVRDKHLAAMRLTDWLEEVVSIASMAEQHGSDGTVWAKPVIDATAKRDVQRVLSGRARVVTPELLRRVADVYRTHVDDRPTEAVKRAFDVSHRTAARYVQQARAASLLPPTQQGRKKA